MQKRVITQKNVTVVCRNSRLYLFEMYVEGEGEKENMEEHVVAIYVWRLGELKVSGYEIVIWTKYNIICVYYRYDLASSA